MEQVPPNFSTPLSPLDKAPPGGRAEAGSMAVVRQSLEASPPGRVTGPRAEGTARLLAACWILGGCWLATGWGRWTWRSDGAEVSEHFNLKVELPVQPHVFVFTWISPLLYLEVDANFCAILSFLDVALIM